MKISKTVFLVVLALASGQDPPDPDTTQPAEPTEEGLKLVLQLISKQRYRRHHALMWYTPYFAKFTFIILKHP